ncbi:hypothetical protein GTY56_02920, partial [Streptomyces sp. SID5643]|nr:hypothetical protein [Streptomyces sp. SID5643]
AVWSAGRTARAAALASLLCAAALAGAAAMSGGPIGSAVLSRFGPVWWQVAAATLAWLWLLAIPTAVGVRAWRCRSPRAEEPKIGKQRETAADGTRGQRRARKHGRGWFTRTGVAGMAGVTGVTEPARGAVRPERDEADQSVRGLGEPGDAWEAESGGRAARDASPAHGAPSPCRPTGPREQDRETDFGLYDFLPSGPEREPYDTMAPRPYDTPAPEPYGTPAPPGRSRPPETS